MQQQKRRNKDYNAQQSIFEANKNGQYVWINKTYEVLIGRSLRQIKGNGWLNSIHPDMRQKVYEQWNAAIQQERVFEMDYQVVNILTEQVIDVSSEAYAIKNINGDIQGYVGYIRKIQRK